MYGIFVLGAGFSKPAGFPLGSELMSRVLAAAKARGPLHRNVLLPDIKNFLAYLAQAKDKPIGEEEINIEEFVTYLDIDRTLGLEPDYFFHGNRSQSAIRNLIAFVLFQCQQNMSQQQWQLYEDFARRLEPTDVVITFNYDLILETSLKRIGKPFRLFPFRQREGGSVGPEKEIVILKLHGSIDWFDISGFYHYEQHLGFSEIDGLPKSLVFNSQYFVPTQIVDDERDNDDLLRNLYTIENLGTYFEQSDFLIDVPFIVSPSYQKLVHLSPIRKFWQSFDSAGAVNSKLAVIGFSLPDYDEYVRQALYWTVRNFQEVNSVEKSDVVLVDYRQSQDQIEDYKSNYRFVNWAKARTHFDGLDSQAIDMIFS